MTVKEIEKLTTVSPSCIKHRYQGGVPGFTLVHTPAGYTGYGLIYRVDGKRKKLTLGSTKRLTLGDARDHAVERHHFLCIGAIWLANYPTVSVGPNPSASI